MSSDLIRCCICFGDYDLEENIPVMLSQCGHNTCEPCANSIIKSAHPECPVCRKMFSKDPTATKYVPNRQIKEQLEKEGQYQSCKVHEGRLLEFYCKTDKCKVCVDCCFSKGEQSHKGHEVERIADLKEEIDNKRKVFEEHLESCRMTHEEVKSLINKKKQELLDKNKEIERVAKLIALEASLRVRDVFDEEEEKMEKICGKDSEMTKQIQDKVSEYKNIKNADLALLLEENPEEFTKKLDNSKVQEYLQSLNNDQIKLPGAPMITVDNNKVTIKAPARLTHLKVNGYLKFELKGDELSIIADQKFNNNIALDLNNWDKEVKKVNITFNQCDFNDDDMQIITYLWTRLQPQVDTVDINYRNIGSSENAIEHLIDFKRVIFSQPQTLKSIGLNFFHSNGSEPYTQFFIEKIWPQSLNLASLRLAFTSTELSNDTLCKLISTLNSRPKGLTHFSLALKQKKGWEPLPLKLPNLKSLMFSTDQRNIARTIKKGFIHESILSSKALEECDIELPNVEDEHFVSLLSLLYLLPHLKTIKIDMSNYCTSKSVVDNLTAQLREHLKDLQVVNININYAGPLFTGNGGVGLGLGGGGLFANLPQTSMTSSVFGQRSTAASSGTGGLFGNQLRNTAPSAASVQQPNRFNVGFSSNNNQPSQQPNVLANIPQQQSRNLFGNTNNRGSFFG